MARFVDEIEAALKAGRLHDEIVKDTLADFRAQFYGKSGESREPFLILNDRGLRKSLDMRLIKSDVKVEDVQIQPASLDCKVSDIDVVDEPAATFGFFGRPRHDFYDFGIPCYVMADVAFSQNFRYNVKNFHPHVVLRSSLGRVGIAPITHALIPIYTDEVGLKSGVEVANFSPNDVELDHGDRFAQVLWGLSFKGIVDEGKARLRKDAVKFLDVVGSVESGIEIKDENLLRYMSSQGLFSVSRELVLHQGFVVLHASNEAYRLRDVGRIKLSEKRSDLLEPVDISNGYTPKPGEHLLVKARESLKLSDRVGIDFLGNFMAICGLLNEPGERGSRRRFQVGATNLVNAAWFDPGYEGIYMAHIKNVDTLPVDIRPDDQIGFGCVFYFPKGVERPYGSAALQSHYQGAKTAQVLQNK